MNVTLYIFKVQREFVDSALGDRYIAQVHQFGTTKSKWTGVESLVELHYKIQSAFGGMDWSEVETSLEDKGGYILTKEIEEFQYHQLFAGQ
ncbi:hypothetical protein [Tunturiibacter gelidiferens]|uniref:hypothetical protein n=1 Tax=Tunturiibacter gelidiferens TaxID=3069689 RepID=UPI003D9B2680